MSPDGTHGVSRCARLGDERMCTQLQATSNAGAREWSAAATPTTAHDSNFDETWISNDTSISSNCSPSYLFLFFESVHSVQKTGSSAPGD